MHFQANGKVLLKKTYFCETLFGKANEVYNEKNSFILIPTFFQCF
jgi:hypothetical protein